MFWKIETGKIAAVPIPKLQAPQTQRGKTP